MNYFLTIATESAGRRQYRGSWGTVPSGSLVCVVCSICVSCLRDVVWGATVGCLCASEEQLGTGAFLAVAVSCQCRAVSWGSCRGTLGKDREAWGRGSAVRSHGTTNTWAGVGGAGW